MARTYNRRNDEIEEFNDDALRVQESENTERVLIHLEEDEAEGLELGDRGRKGFSRLNDRYLFGDRD